MTHFVSDMDGAATGGKWFGFFRVGSREAGSLGFLKQGCRMPLLSLGLMLLSGAGASGVEWPQYAGPNLDGSSPETIRTNWSEVPPRVLWRKAIGPGFSSITTGGGRLFTQAKSAAVVSGAREICRAFDAETGNNLWQVDVGSTQYTDLSGYDDRIDGPRSTPTVDGDFVYVLNSYLKLFCLRAATGAEVWSRDLRTELGSQIIAWQNAASPLIVGDLIFLNSNAGTQKLMALRKSDGGTVWRAENGTMTHATPTYAVIEGVPQIIFLTLSGLVSMVPETGGTLWKLPFGPSSTSTASSPVVSGNYVHATAAYGSGTWVARVVKSGDGFRATTNQVNRRGVDYQCHWSTGVEHDGFVYSIPSPSSGQAKLACFDPIGVTNRWAQSTVGSGPIGFGSVIKAANTLVVMTENGELVLVEPNPKAFRQIASFKAFSQPQQLCWNRSTIANGRIYARNSALSSEILALDVAPPLPPVPVIAASAELVSGAGLRLQVRAEDGSALSSLHAQQLEVATTTDLTKSRGEWTVASAAWTVVNGFLILELPLSDLPQQFLLVRQKGS